MSVFGVEYYAICTAYGKNIVFLVWTSVAQTHTLPHYFTHLYKVALKYLVLDLHLSRKYAGKCVL